MISHLKNVQVVLQREGLARRGESRSPAVDPMDVSRPAVGVANPFPRSNAGARCASEDGRLVHLRLLHGGQTQVFF